MCWFPLGHSGLDYQRMNEAGLYMYMYVYDRLPCLLRVAAAFFRLSNAEGGYVSVGLSPLGMFSAAQLNRVPTHAGPDYKQGKYRNAPVGNRGLVFPLMPSSDKRWRAPCALSITRSLSGMEGRVRVRLRPSQRPGSGCSCEACFDSQTRRVARCM